jgi:hypothetical protein
VGQHRGWRHRRRCGVGVGRYPSIDDKPSEAEVPLQRLLCASPPKSDWCVVLRRRWRPRADFEIPRPALALGRSPLNLPAGEVVGTRAPEKDRQLKSGPDKNKRSGRGREGSGKEDAGE